MPASTATIARVGRVLAHLRASDDDDAWLANALGDWLAGQTLDAALGLKNNWRDESRQRARNTELRRIADRHFPALKGRARATAFDLALSRYVACFPRDKRAGRRPTGLSGALYDYLLAHSPVSFATLRNVLK